MLEKGDDAQKTQPSNVFQVVDRKGPWGRKTGRNVVSLVLVGMTAAAPGVRQRQLRLFNRRTGIWIARQ